MHRAGALSALLVTVSVWTGTAALDASPRDDDRDLKITTAVVNETAHTLTATLANVDAHPRHLSRPRAWLGGSPATVVGFTINRSSHTGTLTIAIPNPTPAGSFLFEVRWGNDADDDNHTFEVALGSSAITGPAGPTGPQGPQGLPGVPGLQGPVGPTGPAGAAGANGAAGAVGPTGANGAPGSTGSPGADGAVGPTGPQGANGAVGPTGPQGANGAVGPTGPQGANGPTGPQGANGAVGPTGPQGANGVNGANGAVGPTGPQGANGAVGPTGPQGANGVNGAIGPTGPQGAVGPTGPFGLQGPQGTVGPTGPAGPAGTTGQDAATVYATPELFISWTGFFSPPQTVPGLSQTVTVPAGSALLVSTTGALRFPGAGRFFVVDISLVVDGVVRNVQRVSMDNGDFSTEVLAHWSMSPAVYSFAGGVHTIAVTAQLLEAIPGGGVFVGVNDPDPRLWRRSWLTVTVLNK